MRGREGEGGGRRRRRMWSLEERRGGRERTYMQEEGRKKKKATGRDDKVGRGRRRVRNDHSRRKGTGRTLPA